MLPGGKTSRHVADLVLRNRSRGSRSRCRSRRCPIKLAPPTLAGGPGLGCLQGLYEVSL